MEFLQATGGIAAVFTGGLTFLGVYNGMIEDWDEVKNDRRLAMFGGFAMGMGFLCLITGIGLLIDVIAS